MVRLIRSSVFGGAALCAVLLALAAPPGAPAQVGVEPICPESTGPGGDVESQSYHDCPVDPGYRTQPSLSLEPHHPDYVNPSLCEGCFDAVVTYAMPGYTSLNEERAFTLMFANAQARPTGFLQIDATDYSTSDWPVKMSLRVQQANGGLVTFTNGLQEVFFNAGWGTLRLAAQWDASGLATGSYSYTALVRSYWADGTYLESSTPVRVLIVNERNSPYGLGWSVPGVQRVHAQSNGGVVISHGDGSAAYFAPGYCGWDQYTGVYSCSYTRPAGDFSTLTYTSYGGYSAYTRTYPNGTTVQFDGGGLQTSIQDRFGNTTSFGYTGGRLASVTDPAGAVTTLGYHTGGGLAWIRDPAGRQTSTQVAGGLLYHFTDPDGVVALDLHFSGDRLDGYWPRGQARAAGDAARWHFAYDHVRRLASLTAPTVNVNGQPARPVVQYGAREAGVLAPAGQGSSAYPAPAVGSANARAQVTDQRNNTTRLALDRFGAPTRIEQPLGRTTSVTRNAHSQVTQIISPSNRRVDYLWSGPNLIREIDHSVSRVDTMTYTSNRLRERFTRHLNGNVYWPMVKYHHRGEFLDSVTVYSGTFTWLSGYLTLQPGGGSRYASYQMDNRGRITAVTDGAGFTTRYHHAPGGWMNTDSMVAPGGRKTSYVYDGYGRVRTVTDVLGRTDTLEYDAMNRVRRVAQPGGRVTRLDYGPVHVTAVTDAKNQVYQLGTNVLGWREWETDPLGGQLLFYHDARGNLLRSRNRRGAHVHYTYDALNQMSSRTADGVTTLYTHDPAGLFKTAHVPGVSTDTIRFDARGRMTHQISVHGGRRHVLVSGYGYFNSDERTSVALTGPWSRSAFFSHYVTGQLYQLTDVAGGKTTVTYDARRLATAYALPTGNTVHLRYPSTGQPAHVSHSSGPLDVAFGVYYRQNPLAQTSSRSNVMGDSLREMSYDAAGQLTGFTDYRVTTSAGSCGWAWDPLVGEQCELETTRTPIAQASYTYDAVGNRTDRGAVVGAGNRLTSFDGYTFTYDADGNLTRKYLTANTGAFDQHFSWNSQGQLVGVTTNGSSVTYQYNGWGELISRSDANGTIRYVYDGDNLFMETVDGWAEPHRVYTHYAGVDQPHSVQVWTPSGGQQTFYYAVDYPGNVLGLFNGGNQVVNRYRYDPWGRPEMASELVGNPLRYAGRYRDWSSGLDHNRSRWYDAHSGRFVSQDPIGLAGGINPYAYAGNQPVDFTDPYGMLRISRWVLPALAFVATVAAGTPSLGFETALVGTVYAFGATAVGAALAAGVQSAVTGESFEDIFYRNFAISTSFLAGAAVAGGVSEIGANGVYQGYLKTKRRLGNGALTLGSASVFADGESDRDSETPYGGPLGQHERGHTIQFILLSATGKPWRYYLGLGAAGAVGQHMRAKGILPPVALLLVLWEYLATGYGTF